MFILVHQIFDDTSSALRSGHLLSGCATHGPIHIDDPANGLAVPNSLVIGGVNSLPLNGLVIDGKRYQVFEGDNAPGLASFAIELPAGKHTVEAVGKYMGSSYTNYPINRTFESKPGEIVSLGSATVAGMLVGKFVHAWIPNHEDVAADLMRLSPKWLARRLQDGDYSKVPTGYASQDFLDAVLMTEVSTKARSAAMAGADFVNEFYNVAYVGGTFGTLIEQEIGSGGASPSRVIHTGMTSHAFSLCRRQSSRLICTAKDGSMAGKNSKKQERSLAFFDTQKEGQVAFKDFPGQGKINIPRAMHLFGSQGIVLISHDFAVQTSIDNGDSWNSMETPVEPGLLQMLSGDSSSVVSIDKSSGSIERIVLPPEVDDVKSIVWTESALVIGPEWTLTSNSKMYFKPWGKGTWKASELPQARCMDAWADSAHKNPIVECGALPASIYQSSNLGESWKKL